MRREELYLADIVDAAEAIHRFLDGIEMKNFLVDEMRQSAVLQKLIVIGEAAARLPADFQGKHADVDWRDVISFRNVAVHDYFSINWEVVWATATQDAPLLREKVSAILADEYSDQESTDTSADQTE